MENFNFFGQKSEARYLQIEVSICKHINNFCTIFLKLPFSFKSGVMQANAALSQLDPVTHRSRKGDKEKYKQNKCQLVRDKQPEQAEESHCTDNFKGLNLIITCSWSFWVVIQCAFGVGIRLLARVLRAFTGSWCARKTKLNLRPE